MLWVISNHAYNPTLYFGVRGRGRMWGGGNSPSLPVRVLLRHAICPSRPHSCQSPFPLPGSSNRIAPCTVLSDPRRTCWQLGTFPWPVWGSPFSWSINGIKIKCILCDRLRKPALYQDCIWSFLQKCETHSTRVIKQSSKFQSDPSFNCFKINVWK